MATVSPWLDRYRDIIRAGRWIQRRGWCPATGGNFSVRLSDELLAITASGRDKGSLTERDILTVDLEGNPQRTDLKPSAETLLHATLYDLDPEIGAVLHTHSVAATVLSMCTGEQWLTITGMEMLKSLRGFTSHTDALLLPVLDNDQDMRVLAARLRDLAQFEQLSCGFLVRGHGLYCWGRDMDEARRHLEGLEFLFSCQLELKRLGQEV